MESSSLCELTLRAVFHTAHRLPQLPGKCAHLHGHTWQAFATIVGPVGPTGIVADFGQVKEIMRGFTDEHLDHGTMLGRRDPLVDALRENSCKVYVFGETDHTRDMEWPTVENVARMLHRYLSEAVQVDGDLYLSGVRVRETENNEAAHTWVC